MCVFNIVCKEIEGFEVDDIIVIFVCQVCDVGGCCIIISSDKDFMQFVGDGVEMFDVMKNKCIDSDGVVEKFGVGLDRVVDVQVLVGDSVDNVSGVSGIGVKIVVFLINEYGGLDSFLDCVEEIK